jgi:hypothetical protein
LLRNDDLHGRFDDRRRAGKVSSQHAALSDTLVARWVRKIKDLSNAAADPGPQSGEQRPPTDAEHGVMPVGIDLEQRHEYEGAHVHLRVRQNQPIALAAAGRPAEPAAAEIEHVDVQAAWTPAAAHASARTALNALNQA